MSKQLLGTRGEGLGVRESYSLIADSGWLMAVAESRNRSFDFTQDDRSGEERDLSASVGMTGERCSEVVA